MQYMMQLDSKSIAVSEVIIVTFVAKKLSISLYSNVIMSGFALEGK